MSEAGRKRWWRIAAAAIIGGVGLSLAWVGFTRHATAEPVAQVPLGGQPGDGAWTRAATPPAAKPSTTDLPPFKDPGVIPSSGTVLVPVPAMTPSPLPLPAMPIPATSDPVMPGPRMPDAGLVNGSMPPPAIPQLPSAELVPFPAVPSPDVKPILPIPSVTPVVPAAPAGEVRTMEQPNPPGELAAVGGTSPQPQVQPAAPALPLIPSNPETVEPPLPIKLPDSPQPVLPVRPDSGLPSLPGGTTVKPEPVGGVLGASPMLPVTPIAPSFPVNDPVKPIDPLAPITPVIPPIGNPAIPAAPPMVPPVPAIQTAGPGGTQSGTVLDRPKPIAPPLPSTEKYSFQLPTAPIAQTPGENPMLNLNQTAAAAILGGVLFAQTNPTVAAPPFPGAVVPMAPIKLDDKQGTDVAELKKQVEESNKKLTSVLEQLKQLHELLNGKKDFDGTPLPIPGLVAQVKDLKDKLDKIEKDVAGLKSQQTSLRPTNPNPTSPTPIVDPRAGKGTVRIINEYPVQISMVVNGVSHKIQPGKSLDVDVPMGEFTYQLLESAAASTKSVIKEKETVTLRIK
jgi:hypothetical protein